MSQSLDLKPFTRSHSGWSPEITWESMTKLRAEFLRLGGGQYPFLYVSEIRDADCFYSFADYLDTEKLVKFDADGHVIDNGILGDSRYIYHILVNVLQEAQKAEAKGVRLDGKTFMMEYVTSLKYSFSDTPEWWEEWIVPGDEDDRPVWFVIGELLG